MKKRKKKLPPRETLFRVVEAAQDAAWWKKQGFEHEPAEWTRLERASLTMHTVIRKCEEIMLLVARFLGTSPDPISEEAEKQLQMFLVQQERKRK